VGERKEGCRGGWDRGRGRWGGEGSGGTHLG
jgi:hypothetical protein